jgi:hypothetical protein
MTMSIRISKTAERCISFARFCIKHDLRPGDAAELVALADTMFRAWERSCNEDSDTVQANRVKTSDAFQAKAEQLGFGVEYYGPRPTLQRIDGDGVTRDYDLPSFSI